MTDGGELWGHTFEVQLAVVLHKLINGELSLHEITPSAAGLFTLGYDLGRGSRDPELQQARDDAARWYEIANNPGTQYIDMVQRRIDIAAENARYGEISETEMYARLLTIASTPGQPRRAA